MKWRMAVMTIALCGLMATSTLAEPIPNDITVSFTLCMSGADPLGDVCVIGNATEIGAWGAGVTMSSGDDQLWTVDVVFISGTDNAVEYKYKRADCSDWEGTGNRFLTLPVDGTSTVILDPDSFNQVQPIGCGFTEPLDHDVTVCFQVCLQGVSYSGASCVIGAPPELGAWGSGVTLLQDLGGDLWQACVTWSAGTLVPQDMEYKFQISGCSTWEDLSGGPFANRSFTLDNDSPVTMTLTSVWNDGPGECSIVGSPDGSWGTIKARYQQ